MFRYLAYVIAVLLLIQSDSAFAADVVFQYAIPVATSKAKSTAFLWIPPKAKQVRGVVMAGMTLAERELVKDERIRKACADERLGLRQGLRGFVRKGGRGRARRDVCPANPAVSHRCDARAISSDR